MKPRSSPRLRAPRALAVALVLAASVAAPLASASAAGGAASSSAPGFSASALRDAAAAHTSRGELGEAILAYERAAWLAPRDPAVSRGLAAARAAAGLPAEEPSLLERAARVVSVHHATFIATAAAWIAVFVGIGLAFTRRARVALAVAGAMAASTLVAAGASIAARAPALDAAVVLAPGPLGIAPFEGSEPVAALDEGAKVEVQDRHGTFVRVRTRSGATGWLDDARVESILR